MSDSTAGSYETNVGDEVTTDASLFLGTLLFCVCCLLSLPIFIAIGDRRSRLRKAQADAFNFDTLVCFPSTCSDETSVDFSGCCGCNQIEEMLEGSNDTEDSLRNDEGGNNHILIISNEREPQHLDLQDSANSGSRKRKSNEEISVCVVLDESKRRKKKPIHDAIFRLAEQPSFSIGLEVPQTPGGYPEPPSLKAKKTKRLFKRAVKAITKKQPIRPLSQNPSSIPKTTFLDGGFYAQGNLRLHHQILQSQIDRENRSAKKRRKERETQSYVPPSDPSASVTTTAEDVGFNISVTFDNKRVPTMTPPNLHDEKLSSDLDFVWGRQSPYRSSKRKEIWEAVVRIAKCDHESSRLVTLMTPYLLTAFICNAFAIIDIAIISAVLGVEPVSAYLVTLGFLSMVCQASRGFTDAQVFLCAHAVGAENYFLAGQYIQLTKIGYVLTAFVPLLIISSFMYQLLVWLDVSGDVATLGDSFATVEVFSLLVCGFNHVLLQFLTAVDPSMYSNALEILMHGFYTVGIAFYLYDNANATLVGLAWINLLVAVLFIPIIITVLSMRGWLSLCWNGMFRSNALRNKEAVKQMLKTGIPLGFGSLIRESEWGLLVFFASYIGTDDVATFAVVRRMSEIFSSLIEGLCCGAELRCAYHVGRGNHLQASRSAFKSLIIGMSVGTALAFSFYGLLGNHLFKLLDYNQIGTEMTNLIPLSCLCSIVMTNGMLGWALLGAQGRVRLATFVTIITSWIVTIPIAAIFVFMRVYDLQGLVSAVTMGYSVSSTIIMYLLIRTNWKKRSEKVKRVTSIVSDDDSTSASYPHEYSDNEIRELAPFESTPPIKAVDTPLQMTPIVESDTLEMFR